MNIETHINNLKQYIKDDEIIEKDGSDFANFCKGHIDDIQAVLNELEKKDKIIAYWKEQAEGYSGLAKQIQEEYENRIDELENRDRFE